MHQVRVTENRFGIRSINMEQSESGGSGAQMGEWRGVSQLRLVTEHHPGTYWPV